MGQKWDEEGDVIFSSYNANIQNILSAAFIFHQNEYSYDSK